MSLYSYKGAVKTLQDDLSSKSEAIRIEHAELVKLRKEFADKKSQEKRDKINPKILPKKHKTAAPIEEQEEEPTTTSEEATTTSTTTTTTTTTTENLPESHGKVDGNAKLSDVRKRSQTAYDHNRGTPTDPDLLDKRNFVRDMMKFAWKGYRERAWGYNEVKPDSGRPSTNNIFGAAKTGATIIDALDTLWIMGLTEQFEEGKKWVKEEFNLRVANQMLSAFETVIRFLGGLLGAYHMSGDYMFAQKAIEVAEAIDPAFRDSPFPAAHFNPSTGRTDSNSGRILSEIGSFHLEYYDLAFSVGDKKWFDRAYGIRDVIKTIKTRDGLIANRVSKPRKEVDGHWSATPQSGSISFGAEGDSYYEYLIKAFYQTSKLDKDAKELYDRSIDGAKKILVKTSTGGNRYLSDYPGSGASMQHLACFAGGMIAYGSKDSLTPEEDLKLGADITETCSLSYRNSKSHIGSERFSTFRNVAVGSPNYYILRPEVVESYFYLWRITKEQKYRDWAWEAAQAIEEHCRSVYGYSGLRNVDSLSPQKDDLQRSFFLAETLKYLYLIFSEDDLINLDEFVFNTEAHPLPITKY